jgi:hypothetical protein
MGLRTSVYLSDELAAMWKASGLRLGEVIRRGLEASGPVDEVTLEATLRRVIRDELAALPVAAERAPARYVPDGYASEPFEDIP